MATHSEDWGSTLGTAGKLQWARNLPSYWPAVGTWVSAPAYIARHTAGGGYMGLLAGSAIDGTLTGSRYHIGSGVALATAELVGILDLLAVDTAGTALFVEWGCWYEGQSVRFYKAAPGGTGVLTVGSYVKNYGGGNKLFYCWADHVGNGTWVGTTINEAGSKTLGYTIAAGAEFLPSTVANLSIGINTAQGNTYVMYSDWAYTPTPNDSILRFIGTWNNGAGSGTYQWGGDVIGAPGNVQDRAYGPADQTGWASTSTITLDDSQGKWGSFAGTGQQPFEGTWQLRQQWTDGGIVGGGSWVDMMTGFVEPDGVVYDYGAKVARLTVQSAIARAAQSTCPFDDTGVSFPGYQELLGTITYADADTGTVRVYHPLSDIWEAENGCYLWGTSGTATTSVLLGSTITPTGPCTYDGTGTIVVDGEFPDWLAVDAPIWITLPWPTYLNRTTADPIVYIGQILHAMGTLPWTVADRAQFGKQAAFADISPNARLFGGEKMTDALSGIMSAVNGFYSVDPNGSFRARCLMPQYTVAGTFDFATAYDTAWTMSYEPAYSKIELDCSYNQLTGSYTEHVTVGGTTPWGETRKVKTQWLGSGIEAQSMAGRLYRNSYIPRPAISLRVPGYMWGSVTPGNTYAVHNLPAHLLTLLSGTNLMLYSREYDYRDDLTALELVSIPGGNYAVWDGDPADVWEDAGKVWF